MLQKIEYARRQILDAHEHAEACLDNRIRDEWLKAAGMWEQVAAQYELLLKISEAALAETAPNPSPASAAQLDPAA
jgi:hypothetical protein